MKKIVILLSILVFLLSLTSCDTSLFSHSGQKVTVMIVGLDYVVKDTSKPLKWRGDGVQTFTVGNLGGTINDSKELIQFIESSPSMFHSVKTIREMLEKEGLGINLTISNSIAVELNTQLGIDFPL